MRPEPEIVDADRLLAIRRMLALEDIPLREATRLLGVLEERTLPAGTRLATAGKPLDAAWFVLEGRLDVQSGTRRAELGEGGMVGMLELLAAAPTGLDVTVVADAAVLEISRVDFEAIVVDDFELVVSTLRTLAAEVLLVSAGEEDVPLARSPEVFAGPLGYVERLLFVHDLAMLVGAGIATLADMALELEEATVHGMLAHRGAVMEQFYVVLGGSLRYGDRTIGPGDAFGSLQALAETPLVADLVAEPGTRVLTCSIIAVLDLIEDDAALSLGWMRGLAGRLVELGGTSATDAPPPHQRARRESAENAVQIAQNPRDRPGPEGGS